MFLREYCEIFKSSWWLLLQLNMSSAATKLVQWKYFQCCLHNEIPATANFWLALIDWSPCRKKLARENDFRGSFSWSFCDVFLLIFLKKFLIKIVQMVPNGATHLIWKSVNKAELNEKEKKMKSIKKPRIRKKPNTSYQFFLTNLISFEDLEACLQAFIFKISTRHFFLWFSNYTCCCHPK